MVAELNPQGGLLPRSKFYCTSTKMVQEIQMANKLAWMAEYIKDPANMLPPTAILGTECVEPNGSPLNKSAKDKMKTASAVAISHDRRYLAVGEIGHQPRVFVYNIRDGGYSPRAILNEHRFGIRAIAFSSNGQYLATLGSTNDGFLHIWSLQDMRLHSSNRCISEIHDMKWIGPTELLTVGVRHVRIWRLDTSPQIDNKAHILNGRNVILRDHCSSIFTAIAPLCDNMALVSTEKGEIATVQDALDDRPPLFEPKISVGFEVWAIDIDVKASKMWVAGTDIKGISLSDVLSQCSTDRAQSPVRTKRNGQPFICGIEVFDASLIVLDSKREIWRVDSNSTDNRTCIVSAHHDTLKGIKAVNDKENRFLTWSADGVARLWNVSGICEDETTIYQAEDELTVALIDPGCQYLIVGTSSGTVKILDWKTKGYMFDIQAHGSSVIDVDYSQLRNGMQLFATSSRDRMIQILSKMGDGDWTLHQTLEAHKGSIIAVRFSSDGERIFSCSADRTAHIHKIAATDEGRLIGFLPERVISLKISPSDMVLDSQNNSIVISCDKQILIYNALSGELESSYRTMDDKDLVNLNTISVGSLNGKQYLAGMSSDRAVKVFEHPSGVFLGSDWGHSEGVSGLAWLSGEPGSMLASSGNDGCIFLWEFLSGGEDEAPTGGQTSTPSAKLVSPARKILSKAELAKFLPQMLSPIQRPDRRNFPSPAPSPNSLHTPVRSTSPRQGIRNSLTPTPSKSELQMRRSPISRKDDGGIIKDLTIDELCKGLQRFRERYKKAIYGDQIKITRLKEELRQTSTLLNDDRNEKELLEHFGDKLVALVNERFKIKDNDIYK